ncbi:hypothetical protein DM01DRAFT_1325787 [Hesseltinella vesiculosa]|uniref:Cupredoxin n=1 Tax=Hesseltinella vesiculosa TaxID=101127 RepID=A0A1X2GA98_9FUNG|nr:hypothetical protein DM01DRAFT_1325787 [Hesseltinella vesiculosa]
MKLALFFFLSTFFHYALSARREFDWKITSLTANPDGLHSRKVVGVNGKWPPPAIRATVGDTLVIHTHNTLDIPTALHFHGLYQNGTNVMDGPIGVTQCGIPPGQSVTYEFPLQQSGTYWTHSHAKGQYMDGLRSPLIIEDDQREPYHYDEDMVITVSDWYHNQSATNLAWYLSKENKDGVEPIPQSGLINDSQFTELKFIPSTLYRIRLINMSGFSGFFIGIDDHDLEIIEVDGEIIRAKSVKTVHLAAAQRMSVLVRAKDSTRFNYHFHADMDTSMFDMVPKDLKTNISAPIYYNRNSKIFAPKKNLTNDSPSDFDLHPMQSVLLPMPDATFNLTFDMVETPEGTNRAVINGATYKEPTTPTIFNLINIEPSLAHSIKSYDSNINPYIINYMDFVEIILTNLDTGAHPFHLHGYKFYVAGRGKGAWDGNRNKIEWNPHPIQRDTTLIGVNEFLVLQFRASNLGVWFFHCHIEWHMLAGLDATFIVGPELAQKQLTIPQDFQRICRTDAASPRPSSSDTTAYGSIRHIQGQYHGM